MENNKSSRRVFLTNSAKATLAVTAGIAASGSLTNAFGSPNYINSPAFNTGFKQEPLPYAYTELDKAIDAMTMEIHYTKHAAAYATNLQDAAKAEGVDISKPVEDVLGKISKYSAKM